VEDSCQLGNEPSGSIKGGEFVVRLSNYQFLMKDCVPWSHTIYQKQYLFIYLFIT
jgi:hypothetical protein